MAASTRGTTSGVRAGRAFVELFADDRKLVRGLRRAEKRVKAFGEGVRNLGLKVVGLGTAVLAPLAASAKLFSSYGDQVAKMAKRTGLSTEALSELRFVASQTGTEFESLELAFRKMQRSIYDAGRGLSTQVDALTDLGLTFADLDGLSPEDQFKRLADRIGKIEDPTRKAALAMALFGRTGTNLLPMFAAGSQGIEALQAEARRLGLTMSGEDAKAAEDFTDALDRLWKVVKMGTFHLGAALAPVLQRIAETLTRVAVTVSAWIKQNRQLVVQVLKIAAIVTAAGAALIVLGTLISGVGAVLGVLASIVTGVGVAFGVLASAIGLLLSPIGLVVAAVASLGAYLLYTSEAGAKALEWLKAKFAHLYEEASAAIRGIADALAASGGGDIGLAMKVLWLTLKLQWQKGINFLKSTWLSFKQFFIDLAYQAFYGALSAFEIAWHGLEVAFIETTSFLSKAWRRFTAGFQKVWNTAINWTAKRLLELQGLFDSSLDVDAAQRMADQELAATNRRIDQQRDRALGEAERQRQQRRDRAQQTHEQTLAAIGRQYEDAKEQLGDAYDAQRRKSEEALAQARREWEEALAEAARHRKGGEGEQTDQLQSPDEFLKGFDLGALQDAIGDALKRTIDVRGTFNAAPGSIQGLMAAGDAAQRTAEATEQTARHTKRMERALRTATIAFT